MNLDQILSEWADIEARLEELNSRKEQLASELRALNPGTHHGSLGKVTISPPVRRFDPRQALKVLTPDLVAMCSETVVTGARAKQVLPPALYEQCQIAPASAKPRVVVKLA